jgi:23S rRNA pseudouridine2457 synthase
VSRLLLLNKPFGVICQFSADGLHPTLADWVDVAGVYPAGRLDTDSEGLLLLTDDGVLQHRITDPKHKMVKRYRVQVERVPDEAALDRLRAGVTLKDGPTRPCTVHRIDEPAGLWPRDPPVRHRIAVPTCWLELDISEGRNRQVRRMTAAIGHPTLRLIRIAIGPWQLGGLQPGQWQEAEADSVAPATLRSPARSSAD